MPDPELDLLRCSVRTCGRAARRVLRTASVCVLQTLQRYLLSPHSRSLAPANSCSDHVSPRPPSGLTGRLRSRKASWRVVCDSHSRQRVVRQSCPPKSASTAVAGAGGTHVELATGGRVERRGPHLLGWVVSCLQPEPEPASAEKGGAGESSSGSCCLLPLVPRRRIGPKVRGVARGGALGRDAVGRGAVGRGAVFSEEPATVMFAVGAGAAELGATGVATGAAAAAGAAGVETCGSLLGSSSSICVITTGAGAIVSKTGRAVRARKLPAWTSCRWPRRKWSSSCASC